MRLACFFAESSSEDDFQTIVGGAERRWEAGVKLGLSAVERPCHVGEVHRLPFGSVESSGGLKDMGGPEYSADA